MIIGLFSVLFTIALILVVLGTFLRNHSALSLIGFCIIFLLSLTLVNGELEYSTSANTTTSFLYDGNGSISSSDQKITYEYQYWDNEDSQRIGFWLAIGSAFGFIFMLYNVRKSRKDEY